MKSPKPPTKILGKIRIRYRQIPYVNRYYFVDVKIYDQWKELSKIPSSCWDEQLLPHCLFLYGPSASFFEDLAVKVQKYDNYLDSDKYQKKFK